MITRETTAPREPGYLDAARAVAGLGVAAVTSPLYVLAIAADIRSGLRFSNRSDEIGYKPDRPTPDTVAFPDGAPSGRKWSDMYINFIDRVAFGRKDVLVKARCRVG